MTQMVKKDLYVAHLCPQTSWGGAEIYAVDLAERQMKNGTPVEVWATAGSPIHEHCKKHNIPVRTDIPLKRFNLFNLGKMKKAIQEKGITHLHLHLSKVVSSVFGIKWFVPVKIVFHLHIWPGYNKKDLIHKLVYSHIDKVIIAGQRAAQDLLKTHPIQQKQVAILPYGLDGERFSGITNKRAELGFSPEDFVFGIFARIDRQKGIKEFLLGFKELIDEGLPVKALIMGDKTIGDPDASLYENELMDIMKNPGLQQAVVFKSYDRNYLGFVDAVDVMVLPSHEETYALTILDAFYLKKPVLSTNAGGTPDLVSEDRGWLAEPKSSSSLAHWLKEVYKHRENIAAKGQLAQDYIQQKHIFSSVLKQLEGIYS